ncbi:MAG: hypothetical protein WCC48_05610 [Anaeromyxobacteraceae bacterium]
MQVRGLTPVPAAQEAAVQGALPVALRANDVLLLPLASFVNGAETLTVSQIPELAVGIPAAVQLFITTAVEVAGLPLTPSASVAVTRTVYVDPHTRLAAVAVKTPAPRVIETAVP